MLLKCNLVIDYKTTIYHTPIQDQFFRQRMAALKYSSGIDGICRRDYFGAYLTLLACDDQRSDIRDMALTSLRGSASATKTAAAQWINGKDGFTRLMQVIFHYNSQLRGGSSSRDSHDQYDDAAAEADELLPSTSSPRRQIMQRKESWIACLQFTRRALLTSAAILHSNESSTLPLPDQLNQGHEEDLDALLDGDQERLAFAGWLRDAWQSAAPSRTGLQLYMMLLRYSMDSSLADAQIQSMASVQLCELIFHSPGSVLELHSQQLKQVLPAVISHLKFTARLAAARILAVIYAMPVDDEVAVCSRFVDELINAISSADRVYNVRA